MANDYKPVPVSAAERIATEFDKRIVVINAWDANHRLMHTTTFGRTASEKLLAASLGESTAEACGAATREKIQYEDFRLAAFERLHTVHPLSEYHEDYGCVLWWMFPICEPPYVGDPNCSSWPGGHTHWSFLPDTKLMDPHEKLENFGRVDDAGGD